MTDDINNNSVGVSKKDIDKMKKILENLSVAAHAALSEEINNNANENNVGPADYDSIELITKNKLKYKNYEIIVREVNSLNSLKKVYDIKESETNEIIANDLFLYEAALGIVKFLNRGEPMLSKNIRDIINLENSYMRYRQDSVIFKNRIAENKNPAKRHLYEDRLIESRNKAILIKQKLEEIVKNK